MLVTVVDDGFCFKYEYRHLGMLDTWLKVSWKKKLTRQCAVLQINCPTIPIETMTTPRRQKTQSSALTYSAIKTYRFSLLILTYHIIDFLYNSDPEKNRFWVFGKIFVLG